MLLPLSLTFCLLSFAVASAALGTHRPYPLPHFVFRGFPPLASGQEAGHTVPICIDQASAGTPLTSSSDLFPDLPSLPSLLTPDLGAPVWRKSGCRGLRPCSRMFTGLIETPFGLIIPWGGEVPAVSLGKDSQMGSGYSHSSTRTQGVYGGTNGFSLSCSSFWTWAL